MQIEELCSHISYTKLITSRCSRECVGESECEYEYTSVNECVAFYWQLAKYKEATPAAPPAPV